MKRDLIFPVNSYIFYDQDWLEKKSDIRIPND